MDKLTHFSEAGRARMVDVSEKTNTQRIAIASGVLRMQPATLERIRTGQDSQGRRADRGRCRRGDGGQAHAGHHPDVPFHRAVRRGSRVQRDP